MSNVIQASSWERGAWSALLATYAATTLAVAKIPFTADPNPVVERFSGPQFIMMTSLLSLSLILWVAGWALGRIKPTISTAHKLLAGFSVVAIVSTMRADVLPLAIWGESGRYIGLVTWLSCAAALFLTSQLARSRGHVIQLTRVFIVVGSIEAVLAILQVRSLDIMGFEFAEQYRWMLDQGIGTLGNPNHLASVLVIPFVLACAETLRLRSGSWGIVSGISTVLMTTALVAASTRAAWVGAVVGVAVLSFLLVRHGAISKKKVAIALTSLVLAVLLGIGLADPSILGTRFEAQGPSVGTTPADQVTSGRLSIWSQTFVIIGDNPLLGTGPDSMRNQFYSHGLLSLKAGIFSDDPHSFPLAILVSFGVFGAAILIAALAMFMLPALKRARSNDRTQVKSGFLVDGWVAAVCAWMVMSALSVLSIPMLLAAFIAVGTLSAFSIRHESRGERPPVFQLATGSVITLAFCIVAVWGAAVPLYHNLRITSAPLTIPLSARDIEILDAADAALPWRYEMMNRRAARLTEQGIFELGNGMSGPGKGEERLRALLVDLDSRAARYPREYFAWQARGRSYALAAEALEDSTLASRAIEVSDEALTRFPNDPELVEIARYARTLGQ